MPTAATAPAADKSAEQHADDIRHKSRGHSDVAMALTLGTIAAYADMPGLTEAERLANIRAALGGLDLAQGWGR